MKSTISVPESPIWVPGSRDARAKNAQSLLSRIDSGTCFEDPGRFPHFSRSPVILSMKEKQPFDVGKPYLGHEYPIARSLKEGADYSPDWRVKKTENHIRQITQANDPKAELAEVLRQERDGFIRELVQFHCHVPFPTQLSLERAIRCHRVARTARAIEAMVILDQSMKEIARIVSATIETIEYFEKLFSMSVPFWMTSSGFIISATAKTETVCFSWPWTGGGMSCQKFCFATGQKARGASNAVPASCTAASKITFSDWKRIMCR